MEFNRLLGNIQQQEYYKINSRNIFLNKANI